MEKRSFLVVLLCFFKISAKIYEISDMSEIERHIRTNNPLILFDVEKTLITCDPEGVVDNLISEFEDSSKFNSELFRFKWFFVKATQKGLSEIINKLQNNYKVVALTQCKNLKPYYKFFQLNKIGIDFNKAFPYLPLIKLKGDFGSALFDKGLICCGNNSKGSVLYDFLTQIKFGQNQFEEIVFIDDKIKNLESVEQYMQKLGIPFTGLKYT
jgi:hypothetical protein